MQFSLSYLNSMVIRERDIHTYTQYFSFLSDVLNHLDDPVEISGQSYTNLSHYIATMGATQYYQFVYPHEYSILKTSLDQPPRIRTHVEKVLDAYLMQTKSDQIDLHVKHAKSAAVGKTVIEHINQTAARANAVLEMFWKDVKNFELHADVLPEIQALSFMTLDDNLIGLPNDLKDLISKVVSRIAQIYSESVGSLIYSANVPIFKVDFDPDSKVFKETINNASQKVVEAMIQSMKKKRSKL